MVCLVPIPPGARYHFYASRWDDRWASFKHCAQCWFLYLAADIHAEGHAQLDLGCGEPWDEPPDVVAALAFLSPNEAQTLIDLERETCIAIGIAIDERTYARR